MLGCPHNRQSFIFYTKRGFDKMAGKPCGTLWENINKEHTMFLVKLFFAVVMTSALGAQAFAACNPGCMPGPNTKSIHDSYCKLLTNGGTTIMSDGKTISQHSCEDANAIFGCVWKSAKQEQLKCFGGTNPTEVAVCKQQNNLPAGIAEIACENLSVVSQCVYDVTCE